MSAVSDASGSLGKRLRRSRRRLLVGAAALLLFIGVFVAVVDPFASSQGSGDSLDGGATTAEQTVQRRTLTAQQTVTGTLGYAGVWTVAVPAGTSAADLEQTEQQVVTARAAYVTARDSFAGDQQTLDLTEAELQAARLKEASDCAGANAAISAAATSGTTPGSPTACMGSMQAAQTDQDAIPAAQQKVVADRAQLTAARATLAGARHVVDTARSVAAPYGSSATYTLLPAPGDVIRRGRRLYSINGSDTLLLDGATPAWRSFAVGMPPGRDVAELNTNLHALGFGSVAGASFTSSTERAIEAFQRARGLPVTGALPLGSVVFEPGAVRVTAVTPTVGQSVQPGPIIALSSTRHSVALQLDPSQQSQVNVGDRVLVTLPDNSTTPGVVDFVGKVASTQPGGQGSNGNATSSSPSIPVDVRLLHPADAGTLDQAPVNVLITTASVSDALVVPVNALVALAGGGYAIEEVTSSGTHRLVAVTPGLFDDQEGLVQVKGAGIAPGQRVVVPAAP